MKILFQNLNTVNNLKIQTISKQLEKVDIICLSELNKSYDFKRPDPFQHHCDNETPRIGIIASNTLNIDYIGVGIVVKQDRKQNDKIVIQSNVYNFHMYIIFLSYSYRIIRFFSSLFSVPFRIPEIQTKFKFRIKTLNFIYLWPQHENSSNNNNQNRRFAQAKPYPAQNFTIKFNKTNSNNKQPSN